jgi:hypothetical protein
MMSEHNAPVFLDYLATTLSCNRLRLALCRTVARIQLGPRNNLFFRRWWFLLLYFLCHAYFLSYVNPSNHLPGSYIVAPEVFSFARGQLKYFSNIPFSLTGMANLGRPTTIRLILSPALNSSTPLLLRVLESVCAAQQALRFDYSLCI